ncbi:hypothetical protein C8J57DRAFT_1220982 [Mycena rebaudengoi]|nr:hypothetical protein C8J57DRAFT_1220982 [Mycena rebaudengoi]
MQMNWNSLKHSLHPTTSQFHGILKQLPIVVPLVLQRRNRLGLGSAMINISVVRMWEAELVKGHDRVCGLNVHYIREAQKQNRGVGTDMSSANSIPMYFGGASWLRERYAANLPPSWQPVPFLSDGLPDRATPAPQGPNICQKWPSKSDFQRYGGKLGNNFWGRVMRYVASIHAGAVTALGDDVVDV